MSEALESTAVDTNLTIGGDSRNELDSVAKKRTKLEITVDGCILEMCSMLHLTSAVQELIAHNPSLENCKKVPLMRLVCVTLQDIVLNKRVINYPLAIELLEEVPNLCPHIQFDFQFGSLLVDMKSQYIVYQLYTTESDDKESNVRSLIDTHFSMPPSWDNVSDLEDISDLYSGAKYRLEELVLSSEKREAYWENYILSEDSMKGIWDDVQKKFSAILNDIESSLPKPLFTQVMEMTKTSRTLTDSSLLSASQKQTGSRNSPQQLHSVDAVRDKSAVDSHESDTASNSALRLEGSGDRGSELETASQAKERLELMDVSLNFDQLPEDIVHQKWQDLMERNLSSSVVDDSTLESGDDESSYDTSEDPSSPSEDEEHSSLSGEREYYKTSRLRKMSGRLSKAGPMRHSLRKSLRKTLRVRATKPVLNSPRKSPRLSATGSIGTCSPRKSPRLEKLMASTGKNTTSLFA